MEYPSIVYYIYFNDNANARMQCVNMFINISEVIIIKYV